MEWCVLARCKSTCVFLLPHREEFIVGRERGLAESLEVLRAIQQGGAEAIRSGSLSRIHRERLVKNGFLQEVMKGWYIPTKPDEPLGESTAWYTSYWKFCAAYLKHRFGEDWCLSP